MRKKKNKYKLIELDIILNYNNNIEFRTVKWTVLLLYLYIAIIAYMPVTYCHDQGRRKR